MADYQAAGPDTRRLFVALFPPAPVLDHLGVLVDSLVVSQGMGEESQLLTDRAGWHITLAFLSDVPADRVPVAAAAVAEAAHSYQAELVLCLTGGGTFGRAGRQILWAGLGGDVASLRALVESLRGALSARQLAYDTRDFRPHLTISRPQPATGAGEWQAPALIAADVARLDGYRSPLWTVDAVHLMASDYPSGSADRPPRYVRLSSSPLGGR